MSLENFISKSKKVPYDHFASEELMIYEDPDKPKKNKKVVTTADIKETIETKYHEKISRSDKLENTHIRTTFYIEKSLNDRINAIKSRRKKGWKHIAFNEAIEKVLQTYE
jgi:hypothetical protein